MEQVRITDPAGLVAELADAAPGADTGQSALLVRVLSSLAGGGGGGGVVQQGAVDIVTGEPWLVTGPLTDAQLRAAAVAVSGPLTDAQLRAAAVPVSGPLTDAQLRASAVKAREDLAAMTWVSASNVAPAANAVQCDTGALAAGDYDFDVTLMASDTVAVGKALLIEHRNAANGATLFTLGGIAPSGAVTVELRRVTMAANERLRVIVGTVAGAATSRYQSAIGRRVS